MYAYFCFNPAYKPTIGLDFCLFVMYQQPRRARKVHVNGMWNIDPFTYDHSPKKHD